MRISPTTLKGLIDFFLKAAGSCYAGDLLKTADPNRPGLKVYDYAPEGMTTRYLDEYYTNGEFSGGQTTIFLHDEPVWLMQYNGWCRDDRPETLAFLKEALRETYCKGVWNAGRGPEVFASTSCPVLAYRNDPVKSDFWEFRGCETIYGAEISSFPEILFWHRYQGLLLVPVE